MNPFINIARIEFLITKRCNANCKHCSVPINSDLTENGYKNMGVVKESFRYLLDNYPITSVMAYGGEPLLFVDNIVELFQIANSYGVQVIDLITSGFVSHKTTAKEIYRIVDKLSESGVKRILLSVDAFHQERIPIEYIEWFIKDTISLEFCELLLHPAWLISKNDKNYYNVKTGEILERLSGKFAVGISNGNQIIPSGSNKKNIWQFYTPHLMKFDKKCGETPYTNPLDSISSVRLLPNGDIHICRGVSIGNIFSKNIRNILDSYTPEGTHINSILFKHGIRGLYELAQEEGISINPNDYFGICDFCADCVNFLKEKDVS